MQGSFDAPKSLSRRRFMEGLFGVGAAGLLAACGSTKSRSSQDTTAPASAAPSTAGGASTTAAGGASTTVAGGASTTAATGSSTAGSAPALNGEFKLAWVLPTTGPLATSFKPLYIAAQMAMDDLNATTGILGKKVVKEDFDDQATAAQEPAVFRKLSEENLHYVVGPTSTSAALAAVAVSSKLKVITSSNANATELGDASKYPYNFQFTYTIVQMATACANAAVKLGAKKIGILAEDTAFGAEHTQVATKVLKDQGIEIVEAQKYALDTPDMTTYVQNLKSAGVDTLLAWQTNLPNMTAAFKALQALSWNPTFIGSSLGIAIGPVSEAAGPAQVAKTYTIQLKSWTRAPGQKLAGKQRQFFEKVRVQDGAKGRELGVAGQSLYDFVMLLGQTINKVGSDDPDKVKAALEQVQGYEGMGGTFSFTPQLHSGLTQESITVGSLGSLSEPEAEGFFMARLEA